MTKSKNKVDSLLFYLLWLYLLLPKAAQLLFAAFYIVYLFFLFFRIIKVDKVAKLMWALAVIHFFAIGVNIIYRNPDADRVMAAINTMLLWVIAPLYYIYYKYYFAGDSKKIGMACCLNLSILVVLGCISLNLFYISGMSSFSVGGKTLFETTYLNTTAVIRFRGLLDYSNMTVFLVIIMFIGSMQFMRKSTGFSIWIILASIFCILIIHSRSGYVMFFLSLGWYLFSKIPKNKKNIAMLVIGIFLIGVLTIFWDSIINFIFDVIIYGNLSSNNLRIEIIITSIRRTLAESPLWGLGIKEYLYDGFPLGSHSTYVGFFYKTGIIGLIIGITIFVVANYRVVKHGRKGIKIELYFFLFSLIILFAIEDVDGTNWSIFLYFSMLALLSRKISEKSKSTRKTNIGQKFCANASSRLEQK